MNKALEVYLSGNTKELDAALAKADKSLKDFGAKMEKVGRTMSTYFTAPLVAMGAASIKMASDFNESLNKVDVAFKGSSKSVKAFAKTSLESFGIAEGSALDMAALFGDMSTSMGLSTKEAAKLSTSLVGLAGDLASFKNMNIGEVTTALNGIFTGETESLKRLGVVMTEANLKTFALSKGFKEQYDQMTQGEKVMLRYQYVMAMTSNAQGDFKRTGGGAANQMRIFSETLKELGQLFGEVLLPTFTKILTSINGFMKSLKGLNEGARTTIIVFGGIVALTGPLLYLAGTVIPKVIQGFNLLTKAIGSTNAVLLGRAGLIGLLALAGYELYNYARETDNYNRKGGLSTTLSEDKNAVAKKIVTLKQLIATTKENQKTETDAQKVLSDAAIFTHTKQLNNLREQYKLLTQDEKDNTNGKVDANLLTAEQIAANEKLATSMIDVRNKSIELKNGLIDTWKEIQTWNKSQILEAPQVGSTKELDKFQQANIDILKKQSQQQGGDTNAIKSPIQVMNESLKPQLDQMTLYMLQAQGEIDGWNAKIDEMQQLTASAFESIGMSIVNSLGLGNSALGAFIAQIGGALIKMGALAIAEKLFANQKIKNEQAQATATGIKIGTNAAAAAGPAGLLLLAPAIASAIGMITASFAAVPAFASGGIVSGPTMALTGEYPGAKSNPEVIAPLNKLQGMIGDTGGNNVNVTGEFIVRGQDLVLALNRAEKQYNKLT